MGTGRHSVSVVMPAFNESENIEDTISFIYGKLKELAEESEIIVVDDGSCDDTGKIVERLKSSYENLRLLSHEKNKGYGAALNTGFNNAVYEYVVLFPADNQFDFSQLSFFRFV